MVTLVGTQSGRGAARRSGERGSGEPLFKGGRVSALQDGKGLGVGADDGCTTIYT